MERAGLEEPNCSLPALCFESLFEMEETSTQKNAPQRDRSNEDESCVLQ